MAVREIGYATEVIAAASMLALAITLATLAAPIIFSVLVLSLLGHVYRRHRERAGRRQ